MIKAWHGIALGFGVGFIGIGLLAPRSAPNPRGDRTYHLAPSGHHYAVPKRNGGVAIFSEDGLREDGGDNRICFIIPGADQVLCSSVEDK